MKQKDILIGSSYLFHYTTEPHRKFMTNTIVTIVSSKSRGRRKYNGGRFPKRYKLTNGMYCNASELKPIKL